MPINSPEVIERIILKYVLPGDRHREECPPFIALQYSNVSKHESNEPKPNCKLISEEFDAGPVKMPWRQTSMATAEGLPLHALSEKEKKLMQRTPWGDFRVTCGLQYDDG